MRFLYFCGRKPFVVMLIINKTTLIMNRRLFVLLTIILCAVSFVDAAEIVNRTHITSINAWRFDFNYTSVDVDGTTPIELSAAIFMSDTLYNRKKTTRGCILLNHYSITTDADRPTNASKAASLEGILQNSHCFIIESDGIGFGLTKDRHQCYLMGRVNARNDIDAFIEGRKLLEKEGYDTGTAVFNMGYSQGGYTAVWVDRMVAEGYRHDELPRIHMSVAGGGPYDIYACYKDIKDNDNAHYPAAMHMILCDMVAYGNNSLKYEEIFQPDFVPYISGMYDPKVLSFIQVNDSIFRMYSNDSIQYSSKTGMPVSKTLLPCFFDENSDVMKKMRNWIDSQSLVYEKWSPIYTDSLVLIHTTKDDIVPFSACTSMVKHLQDNGYAHLNKVEYNNGTHVSTGATYAIQALTMLSKFDYSTTTGITTVGTYHASTPTTSGIYTLDGQRVSLAEGAALDALKPGIYIMNGRKFIKH